MSVLTLDGRIGFGKYKGECLRVIAGYAPSYIIWLSTSTDHTVAGDLLDYAYDQLAPPDTWSPSDEPDMSTAAKRKRFFEWAEANETDPADGMDWGDTQCG